MSTIREDDCLTLLLSDDPSDEDGFGGHQRLAKSIINMIVKEKVGKSVAIRGSWGSGKSTVIKLIQKLSGESDDNNIKVIVFDAWEHEGDSLRRTFLEFLISALDEIKWINAADWESLKQNLSRKRKQQEVTSIPLLTKKGQYLIGSTLSVPVGLMLFNKIGVKDSIPGWLSVIGGGLVILPILILMGFIVYSKFEEIIKKRRGLPYSTIENSNLMALLVNKFETVTKSETIENPEPTTIEFQQFYNKIMSAALPENSGRKLILVVDNLDRMNPEEAAKVWATMRAFLDSTIIQHGLWRNNLWLLVPIVPDINVGTDKEGNKSLLDKTFQSIFEVPPPALSKWKDHLNKLLHEALPNHNPEDFHAVYRMFLKTRASNPSALVTPRELKVFVNQLGTIHRQWQDNIPLSEQALYVSLQQNGEKPLEIILDSNNPYWQDVKLLLSEKFRENLAALYLNVEQSSALQIILNQPIEQAIISSNPSEINNLSEIPGFWEVAESVIQQNIEVWTRDTNQFATIAFNLSSLQFPESSAEKLQGIIWEMLIEGLVQIKQWPEINDHAALGIIEMLKRTKDQRVVQTMLSALSCDKQEKPEIWLEAINHMFTYITESWTSIKINDYFVVPFEAPTYISLLGKNNKDERYNQVLPYLKPNNTEQVQITLIGYIQNQKYTHLYIDFIREFLKVGINLKWDELVSEIRVLLETQSIEPAGLELYMKTLYELKEGDSSISKILQQLANQGYLMNHLYQVQNREEAAYCLLPYLEYFDDYTDGDNYDNSQFGVQYLQEVISTPKNHSTLLDSTIDVIKRYVKRNDILYSHSKNTGKSKELSDIILQRMSELKNNYEYFTSEEIIENFTLLNNLLKNEQINSLFKNMLEQNNLEKDINDKGFDKELIPLYILILDNPVSTGTKNMIIEGIKQLNTETWLESLNEASGVVEIILSLNNEAFPMEFGINLADALQKHASWTWTNKKSSNKLSGNLNNLSLLLNTSNRTNLLYELFDEVIESDKSSELIINEYGESLITLPLDRINIDKLVRTGFKKILERSLNTEYQWLEKFLNRNKEIENLCSKEIWNSFIDRLCSTYKDSNDIESIETIRRILIIIGKEDVINNGELLVRETAVSIEE